MRAQARALAAAMVAALVCTAAAAAGGDAYTVRMTPDGQAAARAALLTKGDLGGGWEGGPSKPQLSTGLHCRTYHPKLSDLVIVGAASAQYRQPGLLMHSDVQVFRTERMVALDWRRTAAATRFLACLRATAKKSATAAKLRFVSFRKLRVPAIGTETTAYRTIFDAQAPQGAIRMAVDIIAFTHGRTELMLVTTMALASAPTLVENEIVLARTLAGRVRA
jgi:hypothetical protein